MSIADRDILFLFALLSLLSSYNFSIPLRVVSAFLCYCAVMRMYEEKGGK